MSLVPVSELLKKAEAGGYAVGAFNCNNMEIVQAIIAAAEAENAPVIMQASQGAIKYAGIDYIVAMANLAAERSRVPVALHLDHGTSFAQVMQCIRAGFSSVMIDGSKLPLEENIALTRQVLAVARAVGVSVEAELGKIGGTEDDISVADWEAMLTDPEEARYFVEQTGVDSLAIAIGTAHGLYNTEPHLDLELLAEIRRRVEIPLVLHGGTGLSEEQFRAAIAGGISKINIFTDLSIAARQRMIEAAQAEKSSYFTITNAVRDAFRERCGYFMDLFGASGKA